MKRLLLPSGRQPKVLFYASQASRRWRYLLLGILMIVGGVGLCLLTHTVPVIGGNIAWFCLSGIALSGVVCLLVTPFLPPTAESLLYHDEDQRTLVFKWRLGRKCDAQVFDQNGITGLHLVDYENGSSEPERLTALELSLEHRGRIELACSPTASLDIAESMSRLLGLPLTREARKLGSLTK